MKFQVINKKVILIDRTMRLVGDNEYEFEFEFDEEWTGKVKTARFILGDYKLDLVLDNDKCAIDKTFFKGGQLKVGVYSSNVATEVLKHKVKPSILEEDGTEPTVPEDLWTQLLEIVETDVQSVRNAVSDAESYARSAQDIVDGFGDVVESKQEEFNTYAAGKQSEFNQNAAGKIQEYDEHIIEYKTEINSLKSDLINVNNNKADKTELAKTNLSLDTLWKMNKGQTYDVLEQESEAYSVDVPSGSKYASIDKIGGKSLVWNQMAKTTRTNTATVTNLGDGTKRISFSAANSRYIACGSADISGLVVKPNHKYLYWLDALLETAAYLVPQAYASNGVTVHVKKEIDSVGVWDRTWCIFSSTIKQVVLPQFHDARTENLPHDFLIKDYDVPIPVFDLTQMFGEGNEPSTVEEFEAMFPLDYYPYNEGEIISSQTDRVDVAMADSTVTQQITTGFPALNSAGSVYDYIDLNEGKLHRRVNSITFNGSETWANYISTGINQFYTPLKDIAWETYKVLAMCAGYESISIGDREHRYGTVYCAPNAICFNIEGITLEEWKSKLSTKPITVWYSATEVITNIEIPTELTDWLEVEAGGSITFRNTDDGKRLLIPNKLSFVRKLDEVSV